MTCECHSQYDDGEERRIGFEVFDGFSFKSRSWVAGSVPTGLSDPFLLHASSIVKRVIEGRYAIEGIRAFVIGPYVDLYPSGLVNSDFDFGTHRLGRRLSVERVSCASGVGASRARACDSEEPGSVRCGSARVRSSSCGRSSR